MKVTRMTENRALVVIPARLAASRLPNKPLALIGAEPMIVHVWRKAVAGNVGPVVVACGDQEIADAITAAGGQAVMTSPDLPSGSDRVWAATQEFDPEGTFSVIVNVQGDLPTLDPTLIEAAVNALERGRADIGTLVTEIKDESELSDSNVVKVAISFPPGSEFATALYFSRAAIPFGPGPHFHHIGIYAYARDALSRFVSAPASELEKRERLEQLRGMELGLKVTAGLVDSVPFGVDTPADLERARQIMSG